MSRWRELKVDCAVARAAILVVVVVFATQTGVGLAGDWYDDIGYEGPAAPGVEGYTMKYVNPSSLPSGWDSAVLLPYTAPEYHWWEGCSPTAAGMVFAYWDTYLGKSTLYTFHDGDSSYWDKSRMNADYENNYGRNGVYPSCGTHSIVASWEHHQAGQALGLNHGSWDRNGNGTVDASDRAQWNCLADFMRTQNGGTSRSTMAAGFVDYAEWDDPETPINESYSATAHTDYSETWGEYTAEINNGFPVHVGIPGHSIFGCGYWDDPDGVYGTAGTRYVVNRTTWGGNSNNKYGLVEFDEVYAYTTLRIGDPVVPPNNVPVAGNDTYTIDEDGSLVLYGYEGVLLNDTDDDGDELTATRVTNTVHGTIELFANGGLKYTPDGDFNGVDSFRYVADDTMDVSNVATVTLNVTSVNDIPVAENDDYQMDQGGSMVLYGYEGVLANDYDVDGAIEAVLASDVANGTLQFYASGGLKYTPDEDFSGTDTFTYWAYDGEDYSTLATVSIDVVEAMIPIPGDATGDGKVDQADATVLAQNWGQPTENGAAAGDFNGDGTVDMADASIMAANWGFDAGEAASVPEPSVLGLLLGLGVSFCLGRRRA